MRSSIVVFLLMVYPLSPISAQQVAGAGHLRELYDSLFQTSLYVINGKLNHNRYPQGTGHPYFGAYSWTSGIISNGNINIAHQAIRYDLVNDDLLIQHFSVTGPQVIIVNKDIAEAFMIGDHKFCLLESQPGADFNFEPGYYESVYQGDTEIWIRWKKFFSERSSGSGEYLQTQSVFIKSRNVFYKITNRRSLLRALHDREDNIKAYIHQHGLSVSRAGIDELISLVRYYDGQH
jgi:hypothetical protein